MRFSLLLLSLLVLRSTRASILLSSTIHTTPQSGFGCTYEDTAEGGCITILQHASSSLSSVPSSDHCNFQINGTTKYSTQTIDSGGASFRVFATQNSQLMSYFNYTSFKVPCNGANCPSSGIFHGGSAVDIYPLAVATTQDQTAEVHICFELIPPIAGYVFATKYPLTVVGYETQGMLSCYKPQAGDNSIFLFGNAQRCQRALYDLYSIFLTPQDVTGDESYPYGCSVKRIGGVPTALYWRQFQDETQNLGSIPTLYNYDPPGPSSLQAWITQTYDFLATGPGTCGYNGLDCLCMQLIYDSDRDATLSPAPPSPPPPSYPPLSPLLSPPPYAGAPGLSSSVDTSPPFPPPSVGLNGPETVGIVVSVVAVVVVLTPLLLYMAIKCFCSSTPVSTESKAAYPEAGVEGQTLLQLPEMRPALNFS